MEWQALKKKLAEAEAGRGASADEVAAMEARYVTMLKELKLQFGQEQEAAAEKHAAALAAAAEKHAAALAAAAEKHAAALAAAEDRAAAEVAELVQVREWFPLSHLPKSSFDPAT
jgi:colicin import membrane protein